MAILVMTACEYKDLGPKDVTPDSVELTIDFDWSAVDSIPRSYTLMFYRTDGLEGYTEDEPVRRDVFNRKTTVRIPQGEYAVTAWNNDMQHVAIGDSEQRQRLHATTLPLDTRTQEDPPTVIDSIFAGQRLYDYPDYMIHDNVERLELYKDSKEMPVLTLRPDSMVIAVNVHIRGIKGLAWCSRIKGAQNNIYGKRYIAYNDRQEETVAMMFECGYDKDEETVYASYYIFGLSDAEDRETVVPDQIVLFFWLPKTNFFYPIDISDQIAKYRNREVSKIDIYIEDLDLDLRDYLGGKSMFNLNIEDWKDIDVDMRM